MKHRTQLLITIVDLLITIVDAITGVIMMAYHQIALIAAAL